MRKFLISSLAVFAVTTATPALAQETETRSAQIAPEKFDELTAMMGSLFQTEPLNAEQEARLPAAKAVVGAMMPEGFYGEMMSGMMDKMMRPMMAMFASPDFILGSRLAVDESTLAKLDEAQKTEVLTMLDPAYDSRVDAVIGVLTGSMGDVFTVMEPTIREGLSKAYAVRFDEAQLADISAFFATSTGSVYAKESMALFADPQVMQATMRALPAVMGSFANLETAMKEAMERLPAEKAYEDLTAAERTRMADLLDIDPASLAETVLPPKPMTNEIDAADVDESEVEKPAM